MGERLGNRSADSGNIRAIPRWAQGWLIVDLRLSYGRVGSSPTARMTPDTSIGSATPLWARLERDVRVELESKHEHFSKTAGPMSGGAHAPD